MKASVRSLTFLILVGVSLMAYSSAQLTEEEEAEIVRAHNSFRGKVDPIATNMEEMVS